jgi:hypothetical protein
MWGERYSPLFICELMVWERLKGERERRNERSSHFYLLHVTAYASVVYSHNIHEYVYMYSLHFTCTRMTVEK